MLRERFKNRILGQLQTVLTTACLRSLNDASWYVRDATR